LKPPRTLIALALTGGLLFGMVPAARADHKPTSYCSPSGDICLETFMENGEHKLGFVEAAEYYSKFNLCVTAPDDSRSCRKFKVKSDGIGYFKTVRWSRFFPDKGPGAYVVRWKSGGGVIGRALGFHVEG
jgi:hypothetical protein